MRKLVLVAFIVAFLALVPGLACGLDTGYRPGREGFGFANFGDAEGPAGIDLAAFLGVSFRDEIFFHTGHCFGMARASIENFAGGNASILVSRAEAMPYIDRVQTSQSFYYIADYFRWPFGEKTPDNSGEFQKLYERLASGKPAVLGIYSSRKDGTGHAVVAYRIEEDGDRAHIYVYDPNIPATMYDYETEPMIATFDRADGSFSYDNGRTFDEMMVDDVDDAGVALGKMLSAGFLGLPFVAALLLIRRPLSRRRP